MAMLGDLYRLYQDLRATRPTQEQKRRFRELNKPLVKDIVFNKKTGMYKGWCAAERAYKYTDNLNRWRVVK